WRAVLQGLDCPEPEVVVDLVETISYAVRRTDRLAELEARVQRIRWPDCHAEQLLRLRLAVALGWARLGEPVLGAALGLSALRTFKLLPRTTLGTALDIARVTAHHWAGRTFLLQLLQQEGDGRESERLEQLVSLL